MKPQARDKAATLSSSCIYPYKELRVSQGYPSTAHFTVNQAEDGRGAAITAQRDYLRISRICRVSGLLIHTRRLHTLQLAPGIHVYDPFFSGLLLHSCDPNVFLDMSELWLWALKDIVPGTVLCMDYASTEEKLTHQFACQCCSPDCRGWITGYNDPPNAEGQKFLQHWHRHSH
ncbi:SET domain-containing protein [Pseudomonas brassicacearum]|uniref:Lysine methyltransferase n=1 Tax=Pseudomonas brassicacearum TaxID=930166 RepID=A0A423GS18_9PSED|nr:SET domain-containing protein [Pseudomonas brassicacearum]ROM97299.1 lysine methyltransferase [Pseudomonas brassicacearum]